MTMMTSTGREGNSASLDHTLSELKSYVETAAQDGVAVHEVEHELWRRVLVLGKQALELLFTLVGPGDLGESVVLPDQREVQRLAGTHKRVYQSVFGQFELDRVVYGTRDGQKIAYVPFDTRLQLPQSEFSYLLQDWSQSLAVEHAYRRVTATLGHILGVQPSVDSLERMNRQMAEPVRPFREAQPAPPPAEESAVVVASADGKGVPIRRAADTVPITAHDHAQEPKANRKKMAVVGTVYTVDPCVRTPEDVAASLFRLPGEAPPAASARPQPQHKRLWASLPQESEAGSVSAIEQVFPWLAQEVAQRNPAAAKPLLLLMDGQLSLWEAGQQYLPQENTVEILDLLHATPRIWEAAHIFYARNAAQALTFVQERVLRILQGDVQSVVAGMRQMGAKRKLRGKKRHKLAKLCNYLQKNAHRMRYADYLAAGYPIASGVIEGACRHFVKDRLERSGMRWTLESAQAMLDLRSTALNGDWEAFTHYRIEQETHRLYPHRQLVENGDESEWPLAA